MKVLNRIFDKSIKDCGTFINDRRIEKRYELPIRLKYKDPLTNHSGESLSTNISKKGIRFPVNNDIPKGTILNLEIEDPYNNKFIATKAKAVWIEKFASEDEKPEKYEIGVHLLKGRIY